MVNVGYPLEFDVQRFSELLAGPREKRDEAVALYRGDFQSIFLSSCCQPFRRQTLNALDVLTDSSIRAGLWHEGERYARRQSALDPLRETAYRQLKKVLY